MSENEMILRDHLAKDRTILANQRTLLSFLRTGLYLVVSAIAVFNVQVLEGISQLGYVLIGFSVLTVAFGIFNYYRFKKRINDLYKVN